MRLFVGLRPSPDAIAHLADAVDAVTHAGRTRSDAMRWTPQERWHVTLAFLGEVTEPQLLKLLPRLERATVRGRPLELRLGAAGRFGRSVLWIAVEGDVEPLGRLAGASRAAARRAGITVDEQRGFHPHLTIARGRPHANLRPWVAELAEYTGPTWTATHMSLVHSTLGPTATYSDLQVWHLGRST